jgi:hypothetical protein
VTLSELLLLLKYDLAKNYRLSSVKGARSERKSAFRRLMLPIGAVAFGVIIVLGLVWVVPLIGWSTLKPLIADNLTIGASLFNFLLLISFVGSIAISATTVGNSEKMEYLMIMPIRLRTLFLERTLIVVIMNALIWLVIGTPIFIGLGIVSDVPTALLAAPAFVGLMLVLVTIGVSFGGLVGLLMSRLLAGRRRLKQVGWFLGTAAATLVSVLYYYAFYSSADVSYVFQWVLDIAASLGFTSGFSPGYATSVISIGLLVGAPFSTADVVLVLIFGVTAILLVNLNAYASEVAHYSGWLASGSKRSSIEEVRIVHSEWNPVTIPGIRLNTTTSVSAWYNIASVRREGRVFAQYLIGPLRIALFYMLPVFTGGAGFFFFAPFSVVGVIVVFAVSYGVYFAGYETVYEGKNLMNLQLAGANMTDYVNGKIYSAVPFALVASAAASVVIYLLAPYMLVLIPAVVIAAVFINLSAGAIAANAAAIGGDFKAERNVMRQRGGGAQMPIRGWSMLRAQLMPNMIGLMGLTAVLSLGIFLNPFYSYIALIAFCFICYLLFRNYSSSAGRRLVRIEATEYL